MKNVKLFVILFSLLFTNLCYSQIGWFWQNPMPTASHINDCFFINQNTGFVVGFDGLALKSTNAGNSWYQLNTGSVKTYTSIFFINDNKGFIITGDLQNHPDNFLYSTSNGGENWIKATTFPNQHLNKILFLNENTGFIVGVKYWNGGRIYKTTNSGINWLQYTPDPTTNIVSSISFINSDTGFVAGDDGRILKTTNCGSNWISLRSGNEFFTDIFFINNDTGFVCGNNVNGWGGIFRTTNSGLNWDLLYSLTNNGLFSISFINTQTGYVAGGYVENNTGRLLRTTNTGATWDSVSFSNYSNFKKIFKTNNNELYLMGYWGAFYKSSDSGLNWNSILNYVTDSDLKMTAFKDYANGILVGSDGFLAQTSNSGNNWNQINIGINNSINVCKYVNSSIIVAAGSNGIIIRSSNGGANWENVGNFSGYTLGGMDFIDSNLGYIVGSYFNFGYHSILLKSTNGGNSWVSTLQSSSDLFCSIKFINSSTGFITAEYGNLFKTTNSGNNWSVTAFGTNNSLNSIYFVNNNTGYLGTVNGLFKTTNQGINWSNIQISVVYYFKVNSIYFSNSNTGYLTGITYHEYYGKSGVIFKTINGGYNWYYFSDNNNLPYIQNRGINSISFLNDTIGFIYGDKGTILKTSNGGFLPIRLQNVSYEIPQKFVISQNYPNPFNPQTKIKFNVPSNVKGQTSNVKLIIYDLLGREVATLVNEELKPGTYEADWDGSNFSSGVYFYKIISNEFVETKKMVLMK